MPLVQDLSQAQLAFQVTGGEVDRYSVVRYRGTEGLCQLYRFEIDLVSTETTLDFADVVGKAAVLSINTDRGSRWFHGIVSRFELTNQTAGQTYFRAELVPTVWLLTQRYNSRIFQDKTVKDIITAVLTKAGIASDRFKFALERTYQPREYCVQYRESDYNFICRLMEEEGIWWCFEQTKDAHVMLMADSSAAYAAIEGDSSALTFTPPTGLKVEEEHVFRFRYGQAVRPGAVVLNDFNFKNPQLALQAQGDCGRDAGLEFFDYPGEYTEQSAGSGLATLRAQEFETSRTVGLGQSNTYRFAPGRTFSLADHPIDALNATYLLTTITHEGKESTRRSSTAELSRSSLIDAGTHQALLSARQSGDETVRRLADALLQITARLGTGDPTAHRALTHWVYHAGQVSRDLASVAAASGGSPLEALALRNLVEDVAQSSLIDRDAPVYECRFECIPAALNFRPPRVTPWPVMRGTQTARVVGPSGEHIHTDEYGRVKVQFNWDRDGTFDDKSSGWIRVAQGWAGGNYGILFLPRVGQEVVVDFLEGDPDQPLIVGRVYNNDHMPPYALPDQKTKSVIKTNSAEGSNEIMFEDVNGGEQILIKAQKDLHVRVNNDRVENIGNDRHLTVEQHSFELIKQKRHCEVKLDSNEKIGGNQSLEVVGDVGVKISGKHSEECANYYLKANSNVVIEGGSAITLKVGGNFVKIDSGGVTILGTMVKINSGGSAGSGSSATVNAPDAPLEAIDNEPGREMTYSGSATSPSGEAGADIAGYEWERQEAEEKKTSWIEIELVDEAGDPVAGEPYEITDPDGETIKKGSTDGQGQAHVEVSEAGTCQISFPRLDQAAWERASGQQGAAQQAGGGQAGPAPSGSQASQSATGEYQPAPSASSQTPKPTPGGYGATQPPEGGYESPEQPPPEQPPYQPPPEQPPYRPPPGPPGQPPRRPPRGD